MRESSVYVFECICGARVESTTPEATCQSCHRLLVVEWLSEVTPCSTTRTTEQP